MSNDEFKNGLQLLKAMYSEQAITDSIKELTELYALCRATEDWVAITELKWDFNLTDIEAIKFWHILQELNKREYA